MPYKDTISERFGKGVLRGGVLRERNEGVLSKKMVTVNTRMVC